MEENKISIAKTLLFDKEKKEILSLIPQIEDQDILYVYAFNYNWDDGFEIPQLILDNENCNLSIALVLFYQADGVSYLMNKSSNKNLPQWTSFIKKLYDSILDRRYSGQGIEFKAPLSKVQMFKLKKILTQQENVFIENIEGKYLNISL